MQLPPVLIHPGYHKTGTTFLQEVVFADPARFVQPWSRPFISGTIITPHELDFDAGALRARYVQEAGVARPDVITVLSEEGLCGNPFNGARESGIYARKLRAIFDEAKILITVRHQQAMLRAVYIQYLKAFGRRSPKQFFAPPRFPEFSAFDPDIYCFDRLADHYAGLFGAENVLVLPQELLRRDRAGFLSALTRFVGARTQAPSPEGDGEGRNISPPAAGTPFLRLGNHFAPSAFNEHDLLTRSDMMAGLFRSIGYRKTPFFGGEAARLDRAVGQFAGRYGASNRALQSYCPVDLAALGYEMA